MLHLRHLRTCELLESYKFAQNLSLHLREVAITHGYNPKGIRVLSKRQVHHFKTGVCDAQIIWEDGPPNWTDSIGLINPPPGVCFCIDNDNTISFFDV